MVDTHSTRLLLEYFAALAILASIRCDIYKSYQGVIVAFAIVNKLTSHVVVHMIRTFRIEGKIVFWELL